MNLFLVSLLLLTQAVAPQPSPTPAPQNASPGASQNATPSKPAVPPSPDPASSHFLGAAGMLLVAVKPASISDYEEVIRTLQAALATQTDSVKVAAAKGWRVFKASETDAKGNQLYVHVMLPAVAGFDYRPSLLLDELVKDIAPELLSKYQDAFAEPPSKLNLTEFANMSVAPVMPAPKKPGGR